ncbi:DNA ligase [Solimonas marina]|uniref:DNA ligase n=1 Tax=Solimonas marina TaxID=2714601 RepID=A0A969WDD0_9GAMM|nr:DNA ligase [Solimonas marina]NKF24010.1 DNA ligase [Solimonas marina]
MMLRALLLALLLAAPPLMAEAGDPPRLMLADVFHDGDPIDLSAYWVSEKYDGVRGYWDGHQLWTRGGTPLHPPPWFTAGWPARALDGEIWGGRQRFAFTSAVIRRDAPDDPGWRQLHLMVFDLPAEPGDFNARLKALRTLFATPHAATLRLVEQVHVASPAALRAQRDAVVAAGGEGLVLHRGGAPYRAERNDDLLKYKPLDDDEAVVIGYTPGQGKYDGMVGALKVRRADGLEFRVGSGLSDADRRHPPAIGSTITYVYNGLTVHGVPRFARFLRVRADRPAH